MDDNLNWNPETRPEIYYQLLCVEEKGRVKVPGVQTEHRFLIQAVTASCLVEQFSKYNSWKSRKLKINFPAVYSVVDYD